MSAESSLTAVAVVRALLNEDTEGLAVLLPDGLPEPGRELMASLASLTVLSAKVAARAEGITEGEYLDRIIRLWTDGQVAGLAGGPVLPRVVDELYARAEGNPFSPSSWWPRPWPTRRRAVCCRPRQGCRPGWRSCWRPGRAAAPVTHARC